MLSDKMLKMKKWAVVGVTEDKSKYGYKIYKKLKDKGYEVYPISVKNSKINGEKAYKRLSELPVKVDVVDFVVNPSIGISIISQCKELDIKNVWLQPGTISEEIIKYAQENDINQYQGCVLVALS
ncbi:CoA-binding protein [Clostridiaceae bacterium M8S5]|nr:CoA-binding protein [Clostridiaceae bacterium M8S5]